MASEPGGISASVRRQLGEGRSRDEIVAGLVAGGLSKPSAERFVDREIGSQPPPLPPLEPLIPGPLTPPPVEAPAEPVEAEAPAGTMYQGPPAGTMYEGPAGGDADQIDRFLETAQDDRDEADARRDIRVGSYATTIGIALTLISMLFPGRGVLFYGAVLYGLYRFIRGVVRYARLDTPFPWGRVVVMALLPIVSFPVLFFAVASFAMQRDMTSARGFDEADIESAREVRKQAGDAYELRQRRSAESVDSLVEALGRSRYGGECVPAAALSRSQSERAVEPLLQYLRATQGLPWQSQTCLVKALADLGEIDHAIGYYRSWLLGDNKFLAYEAMRGFGDIGPDAAPQAIPLLEYFIKSGTVTDRIQAAQALGKLGPDAEELLKVLAGDSDVNVQNTAKISLSRLQ